MFGGGLEPRAWRAREREPITGLWGRSPQRGLGAKPLVRGSGERSPPKAENLLASIDAPRKQQICLILRSLQIS